MRRLLTADPETLDMASLTIAKELTKSAEEYATPPPHVQVALDMQRRGMDVQIRDRIPYVLQRAGKSVGSKAVHPDLWDWSRHELDAQWYVDQIERAMRRVLELTSDDLESVFAPVEGTVTATGRAPILAALGAPANLTWRKRDRSPVTRKRQRQETLMDLFARKR